MPGPDKPVTMKTTLEELTSSIERLAKLHRKWLDSKVSKIPQGRSQCLRHHPVQDLEALVGS